MQPLIPETMTAGSKAITLIEKFYSNDLNNLVGSRKATDEAKQCAIIHVKGIIEELESMPFKTDIGGRHTNEGYSIIDKIQYWRDVLTELNQM